MLLPKLEYLSPKTMDELADQLADFGDKARILAGGTDVIPNMLEKLYKADYLVDISGIQALRGISYKQGKGLVIGAATKLEDVERSEVIREKYTALATACSQVGSPQIRAMASLGGNSCNASPAADTPPALVALGAQVTVKSKSGSREMPLEKFIQGNRKTDLKPGEFLEKFTLPDAPKKGASRFGLLTLLAAKTIDVVSLAVQLVPEDDGTIKDAVIAMGAVAPVPLRGVEAEAMLRGQSPDDDLIEKVAAKCAEESKPIDDIRGSAVYRRHIVKVLARRTISETLSAIE